MKLMIVMLATLLGITADAFSSVASTLVLIGTTVAGGVAWLRERKKRKFDDVRGRVEIVDLLNKRNDDMMKQVADLRIEQTDLRIKLREQENKISKLEEENQQLKTRQQELIAENKQLKGELDILKNAGKKKQPVPKKK